VISISTAFLVAFTTGKAYLILSHAWMLVHMGEGSSVPYTAMCSIWLCASHCKPRLVIKYHKIS